MSLSIQVYEGDGIERITLYHILTDGGTSGEFCYVTLTDKDGYDGWGLAPLKSQGIKLCEADIPVWEDKILGHFGKCTTKNIGIRIEVA